MTGFEFMTRLKSGENLRYSGPLSAHPALLDDLTPMTSFSRCGGAGKAASNVWVGGANQTTSLHFDASANLFVQVVGSKKVVLLPPKAYPLVKHFPDSHAHARQSPTPVDPYLVEELGGATLTVHPGDVLYIPPYWFHEITSLSDLTVSANFWCPEPLTLSLIHLFSKGNKEGSLLPIPEDWLPLQRVIGLRYFIDLLIRSVMGKDAVGRYVGRMLEARFDHLQEQPVQDEDAA